MALMDNLMNAASQMLGGKDGGQGSLADMAMDLVKQHGGVGNLISSWVSNQAGNLPVSGSQLQQALGSDTVNQLAQKFGVDANQASEMLAKILPNLVDHATPNGSAQDADGFGLDDVASMLLKNFMK